MFPLRTIGSLISATRSIRHHLQFGPQGAVTGGQQIIAPGGIAALRVDGGRLAALLGPPERLQTFAREPGGVLLILLRSEMAMDQKKRQKTVQRRPPVCPNCSKNVRLSPGK